MSLAAIASAAAEVTQLYSRRGELTHELEQVMAAIDRGRAVLAALRQLAAAAAPPAHGGESSGTPTRGTDAPDSTPGAPTTVAAAPQPLPIGPTSANSEPAPPST